MSAFHIYAFGSLCRGEVSQTSDIDLLAAVTGTQAELSRAMFSIYSHRRLGEIWQEGNPFAWHLHLEAKLIYASDNVDFIKTLHIPSIYHSADIDCLKFLSIFRRAMASLTNSRNTSTFDLSTAFLAIRNFATCFLLGQGLYDFTRNSALTLFPSLTPLELKGYRILERARILCTRGVGEGIDPHELDAAASLLPSFELKMTRLMGALHNAERFPEPN